MMALLLLSVLYIVKRKIEVICFVHHLSHQLNILLLFNVGFQLYPAPICLGLKGFVVAVVVVNTTITAISFLKLFL
jgi:hypothetical protein